MNLVGLLTVELFELTDGTLIFNEIAPRPHNSFHWSIEGCDNSQFEILVRCICGLKIKDTKNNGKWEMYNLIGNEINDLKNLIDDQKYSYHIYGKKIVKKGRKWDILLKGPNLIQVKRNILIYFIYKVCKK